MTSNLSKGLAQLGHFLIRLEIRSSTHELQKRCPHVFKTVFLKFARQTVHNARVYIVSAIDHSKQR